MMEYHLDLSIAYLETKALKLGNAIGSGSFGTVYKCRYINRRSTRAVYAAVKINYGRINIGYAYHEYEILKKIRNEHIVRLKKVFVDKGSVYSIMELCELGCLYNYVQNRVKLDEAMTKYMLQHISCGLQFLHSSRIIHNDLKPTNILLAARNDGIHCKLTLKLCDFIFAEEGVDDYGTSEEDMAKCRLKGSSFYMAPEKIQNKAFDSRADLWSLGMVVFYCFYGKQYFQNTTPDAINEYLRSETPILLPAVPTISTNLEHLLLSLLTYDKQQRLQFAALFAHEFIDINNINSPANWECVYRWEKIARDSKMLGQWGIAFEMCIGCAKKLVSFEYGETRLQKQAAIFNKRYQWIYEARNINQTHGLNRDGEIPDIEGRRFELLLQLYARSPTILQNLNSCQMGLSLIADNMPLADFNLMESIGILMEQVPTEQSTRSDMLKLQVDEWVKYIESLRNGNSNT